MKANRLSITIVLCSVAVFIAIFTIGISAFRFTSTDALCAALLGHSVYAVAMASVVWFVNSGAYFRQIIRVRQMLGQQITPLPYSITVMKYPRGYGVPLDKVILRYQRLTERIKTSVLLDLGFHSLPPAGQERIVGWDIKGKKVFDTTQPINTGFHGSSFSASNYAHRIKKVNGVVMAWLHCASGDGGKGMFIWPVELVIYSANETFAGL